MGNKKDRGKWTAKAEVHQTIVNKYTDAVQFVCDISAVNIRAPHNKSFELARICFVLLPGSSYQLAREIEDLPGQTEADDLFKEIRKVLAKRLTD